MKRLFQYIEDFWFLFFPHTCEACGTALYKNEGPVCFKCLFELPRTDYCSDPENPIIQLFTGRIKIEKATALFTFHKGSRFRKLLHSLKYKNKPEIGILLGKELGAEMLKSKNFVGIDYIIPVPLHTNRLKQRGYNQSEMIGQGISSVTKIPLLVGSLIRNVETVTQTKMTKEERWNNVSGKFSITDPELIENKHVLLVDDVLTTGSTIEACGEVLLTVDGLKLSIAVLAKA
ncbi:MAG TPA: phosphoribosyltransferase family protein [Bacteroidales bacterium]|nr:phosphoribosyltransferase family protein [Bacteroidales bacterium]